MTEEKELVLSIPGEGSGPERRRLRVIKVVSGGDDSTYLVPLPDHFPPGLKVSIHPTGLVHVKSRDDGLLASGRMGPSPFDSGLEVIDRVASSLISRPHRRHRTFGAVLPFEVIRNLSLLEATSVIALEHIVGMIQPVFLGDNRHIRARLDSMRQNRILRPADVLLVDDLRPRASLVFVNLLGHEPVEIPEFNVPLEAPFRRTLGLVVSHLRRFGGVFVEIPEGRKFDRLLGRLGIGDVLGMIDSLGPYFDSPNLKATITASLRPTVRDFEFAATRVRPRPLINVVKIARHNAVALPRGYRARK